MSQLAAAAGRITVLATEAEGGDRRVPTLAKRDFESVFVGEALKGQRADRPDTSTLPHFESILNKQWRVLRFGVPLLSGHNRLFTQTNESIVPQEVCHQPHGHKSPHLTFGSKMLFSALGLFIFVQLMNVDNVTACATV